MYNIDPPTDIRIPPPPSPYIFNTRPLPHLKISPNLSTRLPNSVEQSLIPIFESGKISIKADISRKRWLWGLDKSPIEAIRFGPAVQLRYITLRYSTKVPYTRPYCSLWPYVNYTCLTRPARNLTASFGSGLQAGVAEVSHSAISEPLQSSSKA